MAPQKQVLIADPDVESARVLNQSLRQRGFHVYVAQDGSKALELAVLRQPDVTLFDESCALLDARTFVQILHTNPRTQDIRVVLTGKAADAGLLDHALDGYLQKPLDVEQVVSLVEHLLYR